MPARLVFPAALVALALGLVVLEGCFEARELRAAATGGEARFFLGTDSAPHPRAGKESACGCAGIYTAHAALELYAELHAVGAVDHWDRVLEVFGLARPEPLMKVACASAASGSATRRRSASPP